MTLYDRLKKVSQKRKKQLDRHIIVRECLLITSFQVTITGFDLTDYRSSMNKWNKAIEMMLEQCESVGERCFKGLSYILSRLTKF